MKSQHKTLIVIMAVVILFISIRSYRAFTVGASFAEESRMVGPFETVLLDSNHFGAFIVSYCSLFLGLLLVDKDKRRRLLFLCNRFIGPLSSFLFILEGSLRGSHGRVGFFRISEEKKFTDFGFNPFYQLANLTSFNVLLNESR